MRRSVPELPRSSPVPLTPCRRLGNCVGAPRWQPSDCSDSEHQHAPHTSAVPNLNKDLICNSVRHIVGVGRCRTVRSLTIWGNPGVLTPADFDRFTLEKVCRINHLR